MFGRCITSQLRLELPKLDGAAGVPHQQQHAATVLPHAQRRHGVPRLLLPVAHLQQPAAGRPRVHASQSLHSLGSLSPQDWHHRLLPSEGAIVQVCYPTSTSSTSISPRWLLRLLLGMLATRRRRRRARQQHKGGAAAGAHCCNAQVFGDCRGHAR